LDTLRPMPSALVTGASRGIGREIALRLARDGWLVHAGVRRGEDGERLLTDATGTGAGTVAGTGAAAGATAGRIAPVILDVADASSIAALATQLQQLDALVNNAGMVVSGPVEGVLIEDLRQQFEVNVVGQVAVTQAVLPLLRASRGRVVFIGSVSGRVSAPMLGPYSASKFAIEGIADALRVELRPWRIRVALIEPGSIDTDLWRRADETADEMEAKLSPPNLQLYRDQIAGTRKLAARIQKQTSPAAKVADAVEHALTAARPRARYLVGTDARVQTASRALLPAAVFDAILARVSGGR
jgi:NAD(P)-dependent dehydrogenase (short-subunit alcohol dehydrogenase family)